MGEKNPKQGTNLIDLQRLLERVIFGMDFFGSLRGCYDLKTASEDRSDIRFEISDLNYLHIHVHIAYMFLTHFEGFLVASEATTASKRPRRSDLTSDLKSVTSITYISMCIYCLYVLDPF